MDDDQRAQRKIQKAKARKEHNNTRKEKRDDKHAATRQHDNSASLPHPPTAPPAPHSTDPQPPQSRAGDQLDRQHTEQSQAAYQKTTSRQASNMPPPRSAAPGHRTPVQSAHQPQTHALEAVAGAFPSLLHNKSNVSQDTSDITFSASHKPRNASKHIHSLQQDAHPHTSKRRKVDHTHDGQTHYYSIPQTTLPKENIQQPGSQAHGETEMDVDAPPPTRSAAEASLYQKFRVPANLEKSKEANTHKSQILHDASFKPKEHGQPGLRAVGGVRSPHPFGSHNTLSKTAARTSNNASTALPSFGKFSSHSALTAPTAPAARTLPVAATAPPSFGKFSSHSALIGPLPHINTRQALKALSCNTGTPSLTQLSSASPLGAPSTRKQDLSQPAGGVPPRDSRTPAANPLRKKSSLAVVDGRPVLQSVSNGAARRPTPASRQGVAPSHTTNLGHPKSIQHGVESLNHEDFRDALTVDPQLMPIYDKRANVYGLRGYADVIINADGQHEAGLESRSHLLNAALEWGCRNDPQGFASATGLATWDGKTLDTLQQKFGHLTSMIVDLHRAAHKKPGGATWSCSHQLWDAVPDMEDDMVPSADDDHSAVQASENLQLKIKQEKCEEIARMLRKA
ncbi:unnamed protein product [Zymoseptoria tritici ST99CH_1E4]|uniref:Uncharacterized protein n=1 Tax=Zymoseptoria tritici ST99CH_1E4 TaxID=1276532 RepID=A0A2H1G4G1_ZYMTR|nr:unnamed protein product [Zymoseptoria tritici ST99CH_1E4]